VFPCPTEFLKQRADRPNIAADDVTIYAGDAAATPIGTIMATSGEHAVAVVRLASLPPLLAGPGATAVVVVGRGDGAVLAEASVPAWWPPPVED
jgi:hypothetical protein